MLQPNEETYDFSRLDASIKRAEENGVNICLATATAAHPAWMAKKYPPFQNSKRRRPKKIQRRVVY